MRKRNSWGRFTFYVREWHSMHYLYFIYARKMYVRMYVKITRQYMRK